MKNRPCPRPRRPFGGDPDPELAQRAAAGDTLRPSGDHAAAQPAAVPHRAQHPEERRRDRRRAPGGLSAWPGGRSATFAPTPKLSTWLVRIVINQAFGRLRRRSAQIIPWTPPWNRSIPRCAWRWRTIRPPPERSAMRAEVRRLIEARIDLAAEAFRTVFMLRAVEEMSVEEVATVLELPEATVRTALLSRSRPAARRPVARRRSRHQRRVLVCRRALRPDRRRRAEQARRGPELLPILNPSRILNPLETFMSFFPMPDPPPPAACSSADPASCCPAPRWALLAGNHALAAAADSATATDAQILNTALGAELEAIAAYQLGAEQAAAKAAPRSGTGVPGSPRGTRRPARQDGRKLGGKPVASQGQVRLSGGAAEGPGRCPPFAAKLEQGAVSAYPRRGCRCSAIAIWAKAAASILGDGQCIGRSFARCSSETPVPAAFVA